MMMFSSNRRMLHMAAIIHDFEMQKIPDVKLRILIYKLSFTLNPASSFATCHRVRSH